MPSRVVRRRPRPIAPIQMTLPNKPIPLAAVAERLNVSKSTVHRWRTVGVRGIKLSCVRVGARWFAAEPEVAAFLNVLNGRDVAGDPPDRKKRAAEKAALEQQLIALGL